MDFKELEQLINQHKVTIGDNDYILLQLGQYLPEDQLLQAKIFLAKEEYQTSNRTRYNSAAQGIGESRTSKLLKRGYYE